ncbi:hypothetical protein CAPTEDRAFT_160219 [Capitella teleta]|uniref:Tetraspanin n=1 Tax=Capitella teleta TaxID=283909 RepID=R7TWH1_CAPTE|nr:hypothetical protein CAPTEDRAFT_160219 [Capitella teleta]|eukprot:ELT98104.1 hypothetical protein CAPTEDRAFT_160219 [Capitella teleta]
MGLGEVCGKCVLVLINTIFMVLGILFLLLGIFFLAAQTVVEKVLPLELKNQFEGLLNSTTNAVNTPQLAEQTTEDFFGLFKDLGIVLLVLGLFMLVLTILGCCGSCCMNRCMIVVYVIVVSAIMIVQAIAIGLFAEGKLDEPIKTRLTDTLVDEYKGNFDLGIESLTINMLQATFGCCGINGGLDFKNASNWNRTEGFKVGNITREITVEVPVTCCRMEGNFPIQFSLVDVECPVKPTANNSYILDGCYDKIQDDLSNEKTIVLGVVGGSLALEFICVLLGICLICADRAKDKGY